MAEGRSNDGKFAQGNKIAKGNPFAVKVNKLRVALLEAVSEADIYAIVTKLIEQARDGDVQSARELLDRTIGKSQANDTLNVISDPEATNEFVDYLHRKPELARDVAAIYRRMASDPGDDGESHLQGQVDVAGSPGPVVEQAPRSGDDAE